MSDNTINVRHIMAYATEAQWNSLNPVLKAGELAFSSDKGNIYKIGNGTSTWQQLAYSDVGNDNFYWQYNADIESVSLIFR